jgi:hypothetical protein
VFSQSAFAGVIIKARGRSAVVEIKGRWNGAENMVPGKPLGITVLLLVAPMIYLVERDLTTAIPAERSQRGHHR